MAGQWRRAARREVVATSSAGLLFAAPSHPCARDLRRAAFALDGMAGRRFEEPGEQVS
ncbi:hypothetical protein [Actinophytocola sediminis]